MEKYYQKIPLSFLSLLTRSFQNTEQFDTGSSFLYKRQYSIDKLIYIQYRWMFLFLRSFNCLLNSFVSSPVSRLLATESFISLYYKIRNISFISIDPVTKPLAPLSARNLLLPYSSESLSVTNDHPDLALYQRLNKQPTCYPSQYISTTVCVQVRT